MNELCACIREQREHARHHLDQLIPFDLSLGLDDFVIDEPGLEVRIRPCVVDLVRGIVIVFLHLFGEVVTVFLVVRLDQPVAEEP